ncbi:MAG: glycerol-3-phosphate dehydrogenase/oxidase [Pseudomonadota bacterium]|nr:MAG: glycerol-3-phosphate dehydrogenase/oxidase [Pseudomonadota bacterium]
MSVVAAGQDWQPDGRQAAIERLADAPALDLLIVGGGITGAGVLREAARRGWRSLLVEQRDFAWGTSSRSARMIHGGLRYLSQGDIGLTRDAVVERERLMREAPGLVEPLPFLYPVRRGQFPGRRAFSALLGLYDRFAGRSRRQWHSAEALAWLLSGLRDDGLRGAVGYVDAMTDDARLVLRVLTEARSDGAQAVNYVQVVSLLRSDDRVFGAVLEDQVSGDRFELTARCVVNATGAWADRLRGEPDGTARLRPLRGSHLVVPDWRLPVYQAVTAPHPRDGRFVYIYPWAGRTVIGTTDLDHAGDLDDEAAITAEEVDYLLALVDDQFPTAGIGVGDVLSTWSGVRPIVAPHGQDPLTIRPSRARRSHTVWSEHGLVTVTGGKLTTFRLMALDVLRAAAAQIGRPRRHAGDERVFTPVACRPPDHVGIGTARRLRGFYGAQLPALIDSAETGMLEPVPGSDTLWAELAWAAGREAVVHLDDLLLRRTRLGVTLADGAADQEGRIAAICRRELGWDKRRWRQEWARYRDIYRRCYSLPSTGRGAR